MSTNLFRKVKVVRASEKVIGQVEEAIFSGQLSPGDRLPSERELAERFELSRMTVRDALRVLESSGLVEIKVGAGGGAFVREPNFDPFRNSVSAMLRAKKTSLLELAEARKIIETATVALAAQRATPQDLKALREAVDSARKALKAGDVHYMPHSVKFHLALAEASKNNILKLTVTSFRSLLSGVFEEILPTRDMAERAIKDHGAIYRAIQNGDSARARKVMEEHLTYFEKKVQRFKEKSKILD